MGASTRAPGDGSSRQRPPLALVLAAPLVVLAVAYALWWVSDRLLYIGPLDRAAFGWSVVVPVWLAAPVMAGFAWRGLTPASSLRAAMLVGGVVATVAAVLFWQSVAFPACETGTIRAPIEWALPAVLVGIVVGGGIALSSLLAARLVRAGHPWRSIAAGAGAELAMVFLAVVVAATTVLGPACQRPSV